MNTNFTKEEMIALKSILNKLTEEDKIVKPDYSNVKVGDYMLKDGTTVSQSEITEEQNSQAIGIVAYLYEEDQNMFLKDGVKIALKAKGIENPNGLVIALKNADGGNKKFYEYGKDDNPPKGYKSLNEQIFHGLDGLEMTDSLTNIEDFPAFKAAKEYEEKVQAPKNTTGWYLPSVGEWFCMLNNYQLFSKYIDQGGYWTSSEHFNNLTFHMYFYLDGNFYYTDIIRTRTNSVRPVLAF